MEMYSASNTESEVGFVLGNVDEVVERILTFVPTKTLFRIARYLYSVLINARVTSQSLAGLASVYVNNNTA